MYDVLIVGSGAGGGPLALKLSQAGAKVLVLEKGPRRQPAEFPADEVSNYSGNYWVPSPKDEPHMVVPPNGQAPFRSNMGWIAVCLGGGTTHMGAFLYRFHPDDFRLRSRFGAYGEIADWPYSYGELEPYYVEAEREMGVSGSREPPAAGIPRSRDLPMGPLRAHAAAFELDRACQSLGQHPYSTPQGINSRPYQDRPGCSYCQLCAGFGCRTNARGTSQSALIHRAEKSGKCDVVTEAHVHQITVGRDGKANGCLYLDAAGRDHEVRAAIVCVCCSALESARLLLLSKSPLYPQGLGNGNGLVGRWLQFHAISQGSGRFAIGPGNQALWSDPNPFLGRSLLDHYFLPPGISDLAKGGVLRFGLPKGHAIAAAQRIAEAKGPVLWGAPLMRRLKEYFLSTGCIDFEVFHDYIPNATTFMSLDPETRDHRGLPVARIHLDPDPHHLRAGTWLQERGLEVLDAMGAQDLVSGVKGETASFLVHGTCRAGNDPATSVLDSYCRSHEVPNLFVVDGSFMPTSGGAAPTLTILANSFRTAAHILEQSRKGELARAQVSVSSARAQP